MSNSNIRILVISDSHGNSSSLEAVISREYPFDNIIHCGDGINDLRKITLPSKIKLFSVPGNVDFWNENNQEKLIIREIAGKRFMITHGDQYNVHNGLNTLFQKGRSEAVDSILFGHTHKKYVHFDDPVLFNPGALIKGEYGIVLLGDREEYIHKRFE